LSKMPRPNNLQRANTIDRAKIEEAWFGKKWRNYVLWSIIVFFAFLTLKDVITLAMDYSENPKVTNMEIRFNNSITLPTLTFCMSKTQAYSHFKINPNESTAEWDAIIQEKLANMTDGAVFVNKSTPWDWRMAMEGFEVISSLNSLERETTPAGAARSMTVFKKHPRLAGKRKLIKAWLDVIRERNVTFEQFTQKVGIEVLKRSMQRFQRTSYSDSRVFKTDIHISWISQRHLCFQPKYDEANYEDINDQGQFFIFQVSHNAEKLADAQVDCMVIDFHGRPSPLTRFMEGKGRVKDGISDELCLGQMHEVAGEVKGEYITLENDEDAIACREVDEEGEDTEFDCRSRCRMEMIKDMCDCIPATLAYLSNEDELNELGVCDYTKCDIDIQNFTLSDEPCANKCFRDCHQIRYTVTLDQKGRSVRKDLTTVVVNWGSFEYLTLAQEYKYGSVSEFISAIGGVIGIWLGLSVLSLLQGIGFIMDYCTAKTLRVEKPKRVGDNPFASPYHPTKVRDTLGKNEKEGEAAAF